jgi:GH25 family lysozyme M1 (1,4-beta-N-acetylmuramidase)
MLKGIDISQWQGSIDWNKVKNQVDFVIIRAGYGKYSSQKDPRFEEYYAACERHNIPKGVYWFSYAVSEQEAAQEAEACLECIKGKKFEYPIWFDYEAPSGYEAQRDSNLASVIIDTFCNKVHDAGYYVGLYSYYSLMMDSIPCVTQGKYDIWIAHYGVESTPYTLGKMWQYSGTGVMDGIPGTVDMNYCYIENYPEIIQKQGLNGYSTGVSTDIPAKKPTNVKYPIDSSTNVYEQKHYPAGDNTQISEHFNVREFACKCGWGAHDTVINTRLVAGLEKLFEVLNVSMIIVNSGYRHPEYDISMNGFAGKHALGDAADIVLYDENKCVIPTGVISCVAQDLPEYFGGMANIDSSYTAIHLDVREGRRWYGDETISNNDVTSDFYAYYGLTKEDVYGKYGRKQARSTTTTVTPEPVKEETTDCCCDPDCHCKCHDKKETTLTSEPVKEETVSEPESNNVLEAGTQIKLKSTPIYPSASADRYSSKKSGTYYIYSEEIVNGRIRVTNAKKNVGKKPIGTYVSGFVNVSDI